MCVHVLYICPQSDLGERIIEPFLYNACEVKRCIGKDNYDAVLVSEFASMEDLQTYKDDPRHKAVSALCKSIRIDRVAADYEI